MIAVRQSRAGSFCYRTLEGDPTVTFFQDGAFSGVTLYQYWYQEVKITTRKDDAVFSIVAAGFRRPTQQLRTGRRLIFETRKCRQRLDRCWSDRQAARRSG